MNHESDAVSLFHYSRRKLRFSPSRKYQQRAAELDFKPSGLWLSDDGDRGWREFCERENFRVESLAHRQEFLCSTGSWAVLRSFSDILSFTDEFCAKGTLIPGVTSIDWQRVKSAYGGLLITPYCYIARHDTRTFWYYGWDCASACVWDLRTVRAVTVSLTRTVCDEKAARN